MTLGSLKDDKLDMQTQMIISMYFFQKVSMDFRKISVPFRKICSQYLRKQLKLNLILQK